MGAYQDLGRELPDADGVLASLGRLRAADGSYGNHPGVSSGVTTTTAAAVLVLRHLGATPDRDAGMWLLDRCHARGGFFASATTPVPDLLSTATALHALSALHVPIAGLVRAVPRFRGLALDQSRRLLRHVGRRRGRLRIHLLRPAGARPSERRVLVSMPDRRSTGAGPRRARRSAPRPASLTGSLGRVSREQRAVDGNGGPRPRSVAARNGYARCDGLSATGGRRHGLAGAASERRRRLGRHRPQPEQHQHDGDRLGHAVENRREQTRPPRVRWIDRVPGCERAAGATTPEALRAAILRRYGKDKTFSVPILTVLALTGKLGDRHARRLAVDSAAAVRAGGASSHLVPAPAAARSSATRCRRSSRSGRCGITSRRRAIRLHARCRNRVRAHDPRAAARDAAGERRLSGGDAADQLRRHEPRRAWVGPTVRSSKQAYGS